MIANRFSTFPNYNRSVWTQKKDKKDSTKLWQSTVLTFELDLNFQQKTTDPPDRLLPHYCHYYPNIYIFHI